MLWQPDEWFYPTAITNLALSVLALALLTAALRRCSSRTLALTFTMRSRCRIHAAQVDTDVLRILRYLLYCLFVFSLLGGAVQCSAVLALRNQPDSTRNSACWPLATVTYLFGLNAHVCASTTAPS